ncbi:RecQ family ATP-dependent DNA helicase [Salinisphaera sp. G21_0]|uniref:RecQ family ATP-dependent DNA helicase n=1 Tax=Salinisphaera sp. G21_0 TaxID=2821094 RepID=UPI001ADB533B|nr:RecQ family ATP-dependent DNA helicase [Salinisphaera sp. G21_0]
MAIRHLPETRMRVLLPYCVAWLKVSGGNSVIPGWVRHRFPEIPNLLKQLRDQHCGDESCSYCAENHDPVRQLQRYFNYPDYRKTKEGQPLQRDLVLEGMNDQPLLGILPTGGGKSICFQIPGLVRYYRRGLLTVIISPLQALMKDQVDNLKKKTGSIAVAAIYGMLTPPERGAILEQVRLGDIGLLYLSPEQLRNKSVIKTLSQREIGCWVFDEAHCLSKWGHDFRPDYLYAGRFIREQSLNSKQPLPPVACYTATAKHDVIDDIRDHFSSHLGQSLTLFQGGVERSNLAYEVHLVTHAAKYGRVSELIMERLPENGCCVVYCATRKNTEELAQFLSKALNQYSEETQRSLTVSHFHGGLDVPAKKVILEGFILGRIDIICATNAFGMGVDKDNVRLVIHADIPGSLENYLQEAGRAGRDEQPAECILLFDHQDIETQFKLGALSEVHLNDIQQILRGLRRLEKQPGKDIVITSGELLRSDDVDTSFDLDDRSADTKVKTAIAWLERGGYLERNENANQVFQGKPLFSTLEEAEEKLDTLQLSDTNRKKWIMVLSALINADPDEGVSADLLAEDIGRHLKAQDKATPLNTTDIMTILNQMADVGLVSNGLLMTAFLRPKGRNNARDVYQKLCRLEKAMLGSLREAHPDDHEKEPFPLDLRQLNQVLVDQGLDYANPDLLRNLLKSLGEDGKGLSSSIGSVEFRYIYKDHYSLRLCRSWANILATMEKRHALSQHILIALIRSVKDSEQSSRSEVLVEFSLESLLDSVKQDMTLDIREGKELAALERGLLFLHEQGAIILQQGLAVFRQAMTLKMNNEARSRRYNKGDYDPLFRHYKARISQVHVMNEYVKLGLEKMASALRLVQDYFQQDNASFLNRYFKDRKKLLELATSEQSLKDIVESLGNPQQQAIVQAPVDQNMLVLAGPGSGKTRVVVHRCAYLMRVQRVRPYSILVLCYNHSAAVTLRQRLYQLLGREAREVTVQTFHGLAMRLTGTSFQAPDIGGNGNRSPSAGKQQNNVFNFDELIPGATALLKGETLLPGILGDQARERLLAGFEHILVDEYQDIDAQQYEMISAIAGRTLEQGEQKLSIMAVGDDDQSIYGFRQASVEYIRQFEQDYQAQRHYLVQNYRSSSHIINVANGVINQNNNRMKTRQEIRINDARQHLPEGGSLDSLDPVVRGRVQILVCADIRQQTLAVVQELQRLKERMPDLDWGQCAILARHGIAKKELTHIRSALEQAGLPVSLPLESGQNLPLFRIREFDETLRCLNEHCDNVADSHGIRRWLEALSLPPGLWREKVMALVDSWEEETGGAELPVSALVAYIVDYLRETRREQRLGDGIHLGTVHGAKGMEFPVVVMLDGGWLSYHSRRSGTITIAADADAIEEERRLFYVGMTRSMEQLVICQRRDVHNPLIDDLGDGCLTRAVDPSGDYPQQQFYLMGLADLYLSYAGLMPEAHPIHGVLAGLNAGCTVTLKRDKDAILLLADGQAVAALSKTMIRNNPSLVHQLDQGNGSPLQGSVIAIVRRRLEDSEEAFRGMHKCSQWEVPVVELVLINEDRGSY